MTAQVRYLLGDVAPLNEKASKGLDWCYVCGRKVGKNAFYFEVDTAWELIDPSKSNQNSQGCFPVGSECAKNFNSDVLAKLGN